MVHDVAPNDRTVEVYRLTAYSPSHTELEPDGYLDRPHCWGFVFRPNRDFDYLPYFPCGNLTTGCSPKNDVDLVRGQVSWVHDLSVSPQYLERVLAGIRKHCKVFPEHHLLDQQGGVRTADSPKRDQFRRHGEREARRVHKPYARDHRSLRWREIHGYPARGDRVSHRVGWRACARRRLGGRHIRRSQRVSPAGRGDQSGRQEGRDVHEASEAAHGPPLSKKRVYEELLARNRIAPHMPVLYHKTPHFSKFLSCLVDKGYFDFLT